jgi:hypothetical protein
MDELFEKSYEIIQIIGEIGNLVNNIHLFCNEDEIESLMKKITSDIGMDDITYGTKAYHICPLSTLIVLPFLPIAIPLLILIGVFSVPPLLLRRSIEVCKKLTRNDENKKKIIPNEEKKRIIVMQKKMFNNSKIDVDNCLFHQNCDVYYTCFTPPTEYSSHNRLEGIELLLRFNHGLKENNVDCELKMKVELEYMLKYIYMDNDVRKCAEHKRIKNLNFVLHPDIIRLNDDVDDAANYGMNLAFMDEDEDEDEDAVDDAANDKMTIAVY